MEPVDNSGVLPGIGIGVGFTPHVQQGEKQQRVALKPNKDLLCTYLGVTLGASQQL